MVIGGRVTASARAAFYRRSRHVRRYSGRSGPGHCGRHRNKIPFLPQPGRNSVDAHTISEGSFYQASSSPSVFREA